MRKLIGEFKVFFLFTCLLLSCDASRTTSSKERDSYGPVKITEDFSNEACDYLVMGYFACDDNNIYTSCYKEVLSLEYALGLLQDKGITSTKVVLLFDGYDGSSITYEGHGNTFLFELGSRNYFPSLNEIYSSNCVLSSNTKDLTSLAPWITSNGKQELDMGNPQNLTRFLSWCYDHYDPRNTVLLINDHGSGPSSDTDSSRLVCVDASNSSSGIGADAMANSIASSDFGKVDITVFDTCLSGSVEELYPLRKVSRYAVASPNSTYENCGSMWLTEAVKGVTPRTLSFLISKSIASYYGSTSGTTDIPTPVYCNTKGTKMMTFDAYNQMAKYGVTTTTVDLKYMEALASSIKALVDSFDYSDSVYVNSYYAKATDNPLSYLYSLDASYMITRGEHGYNNSKKIVTDLSYEGVFSELHDIGYMMDMFLYHSEVSEDFKELCSDVVDNLKKVILYSWRRNPMSSYFTSLTSSFVLDGVNYVVNKGLYPYAQAMATKNRDIDKCYYGLTIGGSASLTARRYNEINNGVYKDSFGSIALSMKFLDLYKNPYFGYKTSYYTLSFLQDTGWNKVIDYCFPYTSCIRNYDHTSEGFVDYIEDYDTSVIE